jgi:hypothetical protein
VQDSPAPSVPRGVRTLLDAIRDALTIPPPASVEDEATYLRRSRERARPVAEACQQATRDPGTHDTDALLIADSLRFKAAEFPPDVYNHNPLSS